MINLSQAAFFLGIFFLICNFVDLRMLKHRVENKVKAMRFDPDWINFILGLALLLFGFFFVGFFVCDLLEDMQQV